MIMARLVEEGDNHTRKIARDVGREIQLPASFYAFTGELPTNVAPGDFMTARSVVKRLKIARAKCVGPFALTRNEHSRLTSLIQKWEQRANGKDPRFNVMGTQLGRPNTEQEAKMVKQGWESKHITRNPVVYNRTCKECGDTFTANRKDKQICSPLCKSRYYSKTKKGNRIG
jgi:ribosomal protein S27AE